MDTYTTPVHWGIHVYDDGPPPAPSREISLCITGRVSGGLTTDQEDAVTCLLCRGYMLELGIWPGAGG